MANGRKPGRPRKNTNIQKDGNDILSQQLEQFASSLKQQINQLNIVNQNRYLTPQTGQDFTQSLNISPIAPTQKDLVAWLKNPQKFQKQLRDASQFLENSIMQYQRSIKHLASIMTFKCDLRPCDEVPEDENSKISYMNSRKACNDILKKLNIDYQFKKANWEIIESGIKFIYFRETDKFLSLQDMPRDYCYITGVWDLGFTYAIDLTWFDKLANARYLAPELYDYYEIFVKMRELGLSASELAPYQYYPVPVEKGWVLVFDPIHAQGTPPLKGVMKDALEILSYKDLLKQKSTLDTWKLIAQKIPYDEKNQKFIVEYNEAANIVNMLQQLMPSGVRTFATFFDPQEINFSQSQSMNNINGLGEALFWQSVGISGNLYGDANSSAMGILLSLETDMGFVDHLYAQYNNMVNWLFMLNSRTYSWQIEFYGNRYTERDDIKTYQTLVNTSNMPIGKLYGLAGYKPYQVVPVLQLEKELGIKTELSIPILAGAQMSGKDNEGGAPNKELGEISESGETTINNDSNESALKS